MLKCFCTETLKFIYEVQDKICYRCNLEDNSINAVCLNCNSAVYCNKNCMRKNRILHEYLCKFYMDNKQLVKNFMDQIQEDYKTYRDQMYRLEFRRNNDKNLVQKRTKQDDY